MLPGNSDASFIIEETSVGKVRGLLARYRNRLRKRRAELFLRIFDLTPETRVLDLGGWNGVHIHAVLEGSPVLSANVFVADISEQAVSEAAERYGFVPAIIPEDGRLPFTDGFFDIVFCSSVIEHVTVPKDMVWRLVSGRRFRDIARQRQSEFAAEIRRLGKGYFVQAPYRWWPIETHSWLPLVSFLPRRAQVPLLRFTNRFWIKATSPDWYLPTAQEMKGYFPDAVILKERVFGVTKSLMAYRIA